MTTMDDGIANGTHEPAASEARPLSLFTAPRIDYSLQRLRHYTGTAPEWFQNFVLFTNYEQQVRALEGLHQEAERVLADQRRQHEVALHEKTAELQQTAKVFLAHLHQQNGEMP